MVEPRTFASLTSGLLARKGNATPAMRRQGLGSMGHVALGHEDLGWNDMGGELDHGASSTPPHFAGLSPMPGAHAAAPPPVILVPVENTGEQGDEVPAPAIPVVVEQRKLLAEKVTNSEIEDETPAPAPRMIRSIKAVTRSASLKQRKSKSAFTLRLDPERHLKLRLACAITNRSAQQLVIEALDDLLQQMPQIEPMADQAPRGRAAKIA
ncbi:MAG: hypothetical protein JJE34_07125 [Alphaproteobacteria bacterium]|nr:hypothetical protein [Alphaproteobacteria bacterium]